jgi:prevent-host-death family protein
MNTWQLQSAKAQLTEVVNQANKRNPQIITVRGKPMAVVIGIEDYLEFSNTKPDLVSFLQNSPLKKETIKITRDYSNFRSNEL